MAPASWKLQHEIDERRLRSESRDGVLLGFACVGREKVSPKYSRGLRSLLTVFASASPNVVVDKRSSVAATILRKGTRSARIGAGFQTSFFAHYADLVIDERRPFWLGEVPRLEKGYPAILAGRNPQMYALLVHEHATKVAFDSGEMQEIVEAEKGADLRGRESTRSTPSSERVPGAAHLAQDV